MPVNERRLKQNHYICSEILSLKGLSRAVPDTNIQNLKKLSLRRDFLSKKVLHLPQIRDQRGKPRTPK